MRDGYFISYKLFLFIISKFQTKKKDVLMMGEGGGPFYWLIFPFYTISWRNILIINLFPPGAQDTFVQGTQVTRFQKLERLG